MIGRAPSCDIVLEAPGVSRQHARIRLAEGVCTIADAGSRFGTQLNGSPVTTEHALKAGDMVQCGQVALTVEQRVEAADLLSENHRLIDEPHTLVLPADIGEIATPSVGATAGADRTAGIEQRLQRLLRLFAEISRTLVSVQSFPQILTRVVDLLFGVVPAERAFLLLRDSPQEAMTARVLRNRDGSAPDRPTLSRTVVDYVIRERVAMMASDAAYDTRLGVVGSSVHALNIRSFICCPLLNRSEVIGALYADNPHSRAFVADDLEVLTALANYAAVAVDQARTSDRLLQETRRRERLQRYHSPGVVTRILSERTTGDGTFTAREQDVTVMFCDLVSFTLLAERMSAHDIAQLLNEFFTRMAEHIFEVDGTLDKFIGDAILAVFGAPFEQPDHADRAVSAALAMRRSLSEMNSERAGKPLQVRIALNSGRALSGDIGSPRRREFTVLGDVVNVASRIQSSVCRPDQVVISSETAARLRRRVPMKALGSAALRGHDAEVELFEI